MKIETMRLPRHDWVPNNARLAVHIYRGVTAQTGERGADHFEALFAGNGWPPDWRDGVYDFHHYHSSAHEVLGVFAGTARLELGGPNGESVRLDAGDALMLPAGTGHRCVEASGDFQVVGAYPTGQDWDICRQADEDAIRRIEMVRDPEHDPVTGVSGLATFA